MKMMSAALSAAGAGVAMFGVMNDAVGMAVTGTVVAVYHGYLALHFMIGSEDWFGFRN